ncbi:4-hydroxybenzoate 3-monooxygenase [Polymorphum gilvum]|uniref:p-hydroxybenzoate hydroxylase (4-hydroxybenzoate 3-monooxygenase) (PHBH) n=1 Tax=Polymorphum gilvum (strain LMG 25793 / CGMCC 1.9160 / SL003B-26A1) TaxID=991905 RepID=F2IWY5_POLGS|nr:4-hydroxybenzoate 3-monooxygenase [Polymorphum gilvum]ADZ71562.1 P-hydroxybenzoate hydroxylase (4-hydroxybenzoate 3-monooxygenase) (PHBH) [Polymorphum gilvum SL003B-26A1]
MRTQVGIIGAGPAGLFLAHLLKQKGIESIVLEAKSRDYVEGRVRAGVLEASTIDVMDRLGLGDRMHREGLVDEGLDMRFRGRTIHLDLPDLTGRSVMIYGQQEVVKDLIAARLAAGDPLHFEAPVSRLAGLDSASPQIHYAENGEEKVLTCDFVAGCDGFHGVSRACVPEDLMKVYHHAYDFAWLGVLARARPLSDMTYSNSDRGFALCSRRSMQVSRLYLQVPSTERLEDWSDDRFWDELHQRMFDDDRSEVAEGEIFQRDMAHLRAFVATPMHYGRLYMAGDAVHIVPPAGAKGLNMAVADARVLAAALARYYRDNTSEMLDSYTDRCAERVWKTIRFSTALTGLLHRFSDQTEFQRELQLSELEYISGSRAAQQSIAEQYVNLSNVDI